MMFAAVFVLLICAVGAFRLQRSSSGVLAMTRSRLSMEYIPDGLSKKQWEEMKKKEEEDLKNKKLGAVGITKFQSRSFEAWQKSGGKNLFPTDPKKPLEAKPYMMRPGGSPDGSDLKKKGLVGKEQGVGVKLNEIDKKYQQLGQEGKLNSGFSLPWTNEATKKIAPVATAKGAKAAPAKTPAKPVEKPAEKKGFFGLF